MTTKTTKTSKTTPSPAKHVTSPTIATKSSSRSALFISHASPEDNRFTLWLGAKLTALGYEVWSDLMRLRGGDDWQQILENAMRERAGKVLFVGTAAGASKHGVRNEIQMASDVAKKIGDNAFIIPLRLEPFDAPFLIVHAQYIDFSRGWARGLTELLTAIEEAGLPRADDHKADSIWRDLQLANGSSLVEKPEPLISNWLRIAKLPDTIKVYEFAGSINIDAPPDVRGAPWPVVPFRRGFLSFAAPQELAPFFGPTIPIRLVAEKRTDDALATGWLEQRLDAFELRRHFSDLARQAINATFAERGLTAFELGSRRLAWWPNIKVAPTAKVRFQWGDVAGLRQIQGTSGKRKLQWHYGVSASIRTSPVHHVQLTAHVIFTSDGQSVLGDAAKMHRARRSFTKTWRNPRWRDMMLAFLSWFAAGESFIAIPVGLKEGIWLELPPMRFESPVSTPSEADETEDEQADDDAADDIVFDYEPHEEDEAEIPEDE